MPRCAIPPMCHPPKTPEVRAVRGLARRAPSYRFIPACAGNTAVCTERRPARSVHPRVCGEHGLAPDTFLVPLGSSPRVRGTRRTCRCGIVMVRFIPACAGNTLHVRGRAFRATVHPRVCGEHGRRPLAATDADGSSPRVRGTHIAPRRPGAAHRFIPACAGNTERAWPLPAPAPVHPRVCGEHSVRCGELVTCPGSSPRVRGTRGSVIGRIQRLRFIPACAGNTPSSGSRCRAAAVHPRVCGEHGGSQRRWRAGSGSSPRVRGTRHHLDPGVALRRFIPACAGNTEAVSAGGGREAVHPRVCGEHAGGRAPGDQSGGSSPRVRGTQRCCRQWLARKRFIPACAGNTSCAAAAHMLSTVHPRVCGEHPAARRRGYPPGGSSPRVRGTLPGEVLPGNPYRFIPACAGNTQRQQGWQWPPTVHPRVCGEHAR